MRAANRAHEIDDGHHHQTWRDHLRTLRYFAAALCRYDPGAGGNDDEEKRAPGFGEDAPPFVRGLQEFVGGVRVPHLASGEPAIKRSCTGCRRPHQTYRPRRAGDSRRQ